MFVVSHHPNFIHSGADRKKETSSERSHMEEISEKEDVAPSSPQTPQTPQTPQSPQRPAQSADSSKGHAPPKRFLSVQHRPGSRCVWLLTPPLKTQSLPTPEYLQGMIRVLVREQKQDCGSSGAGMGHRGFFWR